MTKSRLENLADGLWATEHDLFMGPVHFRGRMTVVRLGSGGLLLHSVVPIDDGLAAELAALGPVEHIVAPNLLHHVHLEPVIQRYADAAVWGVPGLAEKRPGIRWSETLGRTTPAWADEFEPLSIDGMPKVNEWVFFHRATGSLVVTDLVFNIHEVKGWITPWVLRLGGAYRRFAQSRLIRMQIRDAHAAAASGSRLLAWPIERVVMAHGHVVDRDAKARLAEVLTPMMPQRALASAS